MRTMSDGSSIGKRVDPRIRENVNSVILITLALAAVAVGDSFDVQRSTSDGGGVMFSTAGDFELSGTIGQPDAGALSGGVFMVSGGFWVPLAPADCNADGCVDLFDYGSFDTCLAGPEGGYSAPGCRCFDLDEDGDVDLGDVAAFQASFGR